MIHADGGFVRIGGEGREIVAQAAGVVAAVMQHITKISGQNAANEFREVILNTLTDGKDTITIYDLSKEPNKNTAQSIMDQIIKGNEQKPFGGNISQY